MSLIAEITIAGTIRYVSTISCYDAAHYYDPLIISAPSLSLAYPDSGGLIKPSYGTIVLSPDLFAAIPADMLPVKLYWLDNITLTKTAIYSGTLVLDTIARDGVAYSVREHDFNQDFLSSGVDDGGTTIEKPILVGGSAFFPAIRTADVGGNQTYYKAGSFLASGMLVYDDYTNITAAATDNHPADAYGTFSLNPAPVATVYITSTTQAIETLADLVDYAAARLSLTPHYPASYSTISLVKYIKSQRQAIGVIDEVCGFFGQVCYVNPGLTDIYFVDRETADTSPVSIDSFDFFEAPVEGKRLILSMTTQSEEAKKTEKDPVDPTKYAVKGKLWQATIANGTYGDKITLSTWLDHNERLTFIAQNRVRMTTLMTLWRKAWASITLPIDDNIYDIGRDLVVNDDTFVITIETTMKILNIEYDFDAETVTYKGPGSTIVYVPPDTNVYSLDADGVEIGDADGAIIYE